MNIYNSSSSKNPTRPIMKLMDKTVDAEYRAYKKGRFVKGTALAGAVRLEGIAHIGAAVITGGVAIGCAGAITVLAGTATVVTSPLLLTSARKVPLVFGGVTGVGVAIIGIVAVGVATSPIHQVLAPEAFYVPK